MLFAIRKQIEDFARKEKLKYRHDSSNDTDDYLRNRIRHHVIPALKEINPSLEKIMHRNFRLLRYAYEIYHAGYILIEAQLKEYDVKTGDDTIYLDRFKGQSYDFEIFSDLMRDYDFSPTQIANIWNTRTIGKRILGPNNVATLIAGNKIYISAREQDNYQVSLEAENQEILRPYFRLRTRLLSKEESRTYIIPPDKNIHCFDAHKLRFPLYTSSWLKGSFFYPLGMKGKKKISDFLTDLKVPRPEKEKTFVAFSGTDIACVLGYRIDERYKVTPHTKRIFIIEYLRASHDLTVVQSKWKNLNPSTKRSST
jgi:tRNA(Ile)-lysidine synthase